MTTRVVKSKRKKKRVQIKPTQSNAARVRAALEFAKVGMRQAPMHGTKKGSCTCTDPNCKRPGQHLRTPNGIADATSNPEEIKKFLTKFPKARTAVATGVAGMIALKVTGEAAQTSLKDLLSSVQTVEIEDGKSRIFLWKVETDVIPEGRVFLSTGLTVLGHNRYFIAPDDLDAPKGKRRLVSRGLLGDMDIAQAPEWLLGRLRPRLLGIAAVGVSAGSDNVRFKTATIEVRSIIDWDRPCDSAEVKRHARSISETGPRMPPAVRKLDGETPLYAVLTDRCQVEALKSLGATAIRCVVVDADEDGALIWQVAELFNQPHKTVLERAELAATCLEILRRKGGQHAQGSKQPNDRGMSAAERILGVSRRDLGRFEKIAGISADAKEEIRNVGLDDNQNALLLIANVSGQVEKVRELGDQYSEGRRKRAADARSKGSPRVSTEDAEDDLQDDADESAADADSARPGSDQGTAMKTASRAKKNANDSETNTESPPTAPDDDGHEPRPARLRDEDEKKYEAFKCRWAEYCEAEFAALPAAIQTRFATEILGDTAAAAGAANARVAAFDEAVDFVRKTIDGRSWIHAKEVYANS
jgi:ParB-like chromosome segregation protein Spo0J